MDTLLRLLGGQYEGYSTLLTCVNRALCQTLKVPYAILDLHFSQYKHDVFAIATSKGAICLCSLSVEHEGHIKVLRSYQVFDDSNLALSLAWHRVPAHQDTIAASSSNGQLAIFDTKYLPPTTLTKTDAHPLEAWTLAWTFKGEEADLRAELYSGGDDSVLCRHSLAIRPVTGSLSDGFQSTPSHRNDFQAPSSDRKTHTAGVTAILPLVPVFHGEQLLLTGSYDEYVRLLLPATVGDRSKILAEERLGGGVWRLKILDFAEPENGSGPTFRVLASCMHAGTRVLEVGRSISSKWSITILARFVEHESMNYASDSRCATVGEKTVGHIVVSTSFYDKKLCVWKIENPQDK